MIFAIWFSEDDVKGLYIRRFNIHTGQEIEKTPADACIRAEAFRERISQVLKRLDPFVL